MVWCQGKTSSTDSECAGKYLTADSPEEKGPSYSICRFPWRKYSLCRYLSPWSKPLSSLTLITEITSPALLFSPLLPYSTHSNQRNTHKMSHYCPFSAGNPPKVLQLTQRESRSPSTNFKILKSGPMATCP